MGHPAFDNSDFLDAAPALLCIMRLKRIGQPDIEDEQSHGDTENCVAQRIEARLWIHQPFPRQVVAMLSARQTSVRAAA